MSEQFCVWAYDDDTDSFDSSCDNKFVFIEGGPKGNGMMFCPYCGRRLAEKGSVAARAQEEQRE